LDRAANLRFGTYSITAKTAKHVGQLYGDFLVAAYRRPDFRVDVTLDSNSTVAGTQLAGRVNGRYLFGGPMNGAAVTENSAKAAARAKSPTSGT